MSRILERDQDMSSRTRVALIFVNYGPYHVARARALQARTDVDAHFIELASDQGLYPWHGAREASQIALTTIGRGRYEQLSKPSLARELWRQLDTLDPEVVVGCGFSEIPMVAAALWARLRPRPYALMFETNAWDRPRPLVQEMPKRLFLDTCVQAVFCGGVSHRQYLRKLGVSDARIWEKYDVVDNDHFARKAVAASRTLRLRESLGLPSDYFLYVGRLAREKNIATLLLAYRKYRSRAADHASGLVLVGDGPQRDELQHLAAHLGLNEVVWTGPKGFESLPAYYALARAFVLPSVVEPWGLVVNEAMACGLPVIVSRRAGCAADLVHDAVNGWTFDPRDEDGLADCLHRIGTLDAMAWQQLSDSSRYWIAGFTPDTWAANLTACVRSVAA